MKHVDRSNDLANSFGNSTIQRENPAQLTLNPEQCFRNPAQHTYVTEKPLASYGKLVHHPVENSMSSSQGINLQTGFKTPLQLSENAAEFTSANFAQGFGKPTSPPLIGNSMLSIDGRGNHGNGYGYTAIAPGNPTLSGLYGLPMNCTCFPEGKHFQAPSITTSLTPPLLNGYNHEQYANNTQSLNEEKDSGIYIGIYS